jgi:hypothetical protein
MPINPSRFAVTVQLTWRRYRKSTLVVDIVTSLLLKPDLLEIELIGVETQRVLGGAY